MQQKISTPSVVNILDTVIRSSQAYAYPEVGGISVLETWDSVLKKLEPYALEPETFVAGLRNALTSPSALNPFVTVAKYENRLEMRALKLVGPVGSEADFEGTSDAAFQDAIAALPPEGGWVVVLPSTYTFSGTVAIPPHVRLMGVHPQTTILKTSGNFPIFSLGLDAIVDRFRLDGALITDQPMVQLAGEEAVVQRCVLENILRLGASLQGDRAKVTLCKFLSQSSSSTTMAASFQGPQQTLELCVFDGKFLGGCVQFESREGTVSKNVFSSTLLGPAYKINSIGLTDNKIIFNHFASAASLSQSVDKGTSTIRYGNTPNTLTSNLNNALDPLKSLTGQPLLTSSSMVLSNSFTHDPSISKDAAVLWGGLDSFTQKFYEERNVFLVSDDPVYDVEGRPTSGVFSWDGATNTLTWPDFTIRSLYGGQVLQTCTSGSMAVPTGYSLVCSLTATPTALTKKLSLLPLTAPEEANQLVLLRALAAGRATWLHHAQVASGSSTTTFDIHGRMLPVGRYVGSTEPRNPSPLYDGFASCKQANITTKVGDQTGLLQLAYERTNLQYQPETPDSRITTDPALGPWYDTSALMNGVVSAPTHLVNVQGTLYGLLSNGLYYFDRAAKGWRLVQGNPAGSGPFTSVTRLGTGICLLKTDGQVVPYNPKTGWGTVQTPTVRDSVSLPLLATVPSSASYYEAGQVDFAMQTANYSLFTTTDGKTLRYYQDENYLDGIPRVFTEAAGSRGLLSYHPKDTGYNVALDPETLAMDGSNGGFIERSGLPLARLFQGEVLVPPSLNREAVLRLDWSTFKVENFAFCQPTGTFIAVVHDTPKTSFYVLLGGPGTVRLAAALTPSYFNGVTPHSWVLDPYRQAVYVLGASATQELIAYHGLWTTSTDSGGWGAGTFQFTRRVVAGAGACSGVVANLDLYNDTMGSRDVVALACDTTRGNRPTWWRYSYETDSWTSKTLTDLAPSLATDVQVSWATANSFQYNFATDRAPGFGVASPVGFQFLVRSSARSGKPIILRWVRAANAFDSQGLGSPDGLALAGAETDGLTQSLGGFYHPTFKAVMWLTIGAANQVKMYTLFEIAATTATVWGISRIGSGGTYLSGLSLGTPSVISRSGSMFGRTFGDSFLGASSVVEDVFFWSQTQGLIQGVLSGSVTGFTSESWSVVNKRIPADQAVFSNTPTNCYQAQVGLDRAGELSIQCASFAEPELPVHGAASFGSPSDYEGVSWFDTGTMVKNLGLPHLWAGLSRGGYLWIANARSSQARQVEYTFGSTVRGEITLTGLLATSDFDWALSADEQSVGIVYRTSSAPNNLIFCLYNVANNTLTRERAATDFTGSYITSLSSVPQITFNAVAGTWDIVAAEGSRDGGQLVFYRRLANQPDPSIAWSGERVGNGGEKPLASMTAQAGKLPTKPLVMNDGSLLVATESGANSDVLVVLRSAAGDWSTVHQTASGGFVAPRLAKTDGFYWIVGGSTSGQSGALKSPLGTSGWSSVVTPSLSQTTALSPYCRVQNPVAYAAGQNLYVASALRSETGTSANQEVGVFTFSDDGSITGSAFAARSRLGQLSGQEETSFANLSWTFKGDLLYSALRPGKTVRHWTITRSLNSWKSLGESVVGPGRLLSVGEKQYREELVSINQAETRIVVEYPSLEKHVLLPLGTRRVGETFGLRWQALAYTGSLFGVEDATNATMDSTLSSGTLAIITSRRWPRVYGTTQGILSGASVFGHGAGLRLSQPSGLTSSSYFGATLPASGLFRIEALAALTFVGSHAFKTSDSLRAYSLNGPLTFLLTSEGQNLVLEFSTTDSLVLDPLPTGLSYWLNQEHPVEKYAIVLGQNKENGFLLCDGTFLNHGNYEPREISTFDQRFENRIPPSYVPAFNFFLEQIPTSIAKRFKFKIEGTNHGLQSIDMSASSISQLVVNGPLALGFCFIDLLTDRLRASATLIRPICTAHASGDVVVIGD